MTSYLDMVPMELQIIVGVKVESMLSRKATKPVTKAAARELPDPKAICPFV
jgi:hypothetical protein